ncbi:hypothetical protein [Stenotrophomonas acidaminiphila]
MYDYVDYILANYLSAKMGDSEKEAISALRAHISSNAELAEGIRNDLGGAMADEGYSWKEAFSRNDVVDFDDEIQARAYARSLLWDQLFVV